MSHAEHDQLAALALDPADAPDAVSEHAEVCPECGYVGAAANSVFIWGGYWSRFSWPWPSALRAAQERCF